MGGVRYGPGGGKLPPVAVPHEPLKRGGRSRHSPLPPDRLSRGGVEDHNHKIRRQVWGDKTWET